MAKVVITPEARAEFAALPRTIQGRVYEIFERLVNWPHVSGAKPLRGELQGNFRIRTGSYLVIFRPSADGSVVTVWKIGNRGGIYD
jgi:mRNA-degrading endonuclease RelE of RelBE toxin-antitoxin system